MTATVAGAEAEMVISWDGGSTGPAWRAVTRAAPSARSVRLGEQLGELEDLAGLKAWLRDGEQAAAAGNIAHSEYVRLLEVAQVVEADLRAAGGSA